MQPPNRQHCDWRTNKDSIVLIYREFDTPILFAAGSVAELQPLIEQLNAPRFILQIKEDTAEILARRYELPVQKPMWRMGLVDDSKLPTAPSKARRLTLDDLSAVETLYADGAARHESPDFFFPFMLRDGVFFGMEDEDGRLAAAAGTHLLCSGESVAAIGNVYTRLDARGRGFGKAVTAAVATELRRTGIRTIALNVHRQNPPAIHIYESLGFVRHCQYIEGTALRSLSA